MFKIIKGSFFYLWLIFLLSALLSQSLQARDLEEIKKSGVLRHIGIPYANFVGHYQEGDINIETGLDVELIRGFANYLGVRYEYVAANWNNVFTLLNGESAHYQDKQLIIGKQHSPIMGDVIANGATTLAWRKQVVDFSDDYFPSAVWLIARADSALSPITPSGSIEQDIMQVKKMMKGIDLLVMENSCLDPNLYELDKTGAHIIPANKALKLNEMVPAILNNDAQATLLDVPDALIALQYWPGEIKVIGPISQEQRMAVAFRKDSVQLRETFNTYLQQLKKEGTYNQLVNKYYPSVFDFYDGFFNTEQKVEMQ